MLIKYSEWSNSQPKIKKTIDGMDISSKGNFAFGECPEFTVEAPRKLGASAVVLRINKDGQPDCDYPFSFIGTKGGVDTYRLKINTKKLCDKDEDGLFFYELLFLRGSDTLFTSTHNNVDFTLKTYSDRRFTMLVYREDLRTPDWFCGRTMYQIFPDRFYRGEGKVGIRGDAIINEDWENGIPQYTEKPGEPLKNNMFFGGNLWGIAQKLPYLRDMGVGIIYLNPVFEAYSNHKYDTADYSKIDEMFGGEDAFDHLIAQAEKYDIKIILDGVFNHTGDNSLYFDKYGEYGNVGAYANEKSEYRKWYNFGTDKDDYESWWGIKIMPRLKHNVEDCRRYFTGKDGIGAKYIKRGISGWRLDVADELCDDFLDEFCSSVKNESHGDAIIIGEVWENAVEKISYGERRKYFRGRQLDSVMNYPLRSGILDFILKKDAEQLGDVLISIYSTYPKAVCDSLMNILGTHDTERVLTVFGKSSSEVCWDNGSELAHRRLSQKERELAVKRLMLASSIQYTVYGVPSLYYGDEAGLEGYHDPFCRMPYPWGREDEKLMAHYRCLGRLRKEHRSVFAKGEFKLLRASKGVLAYTRYNKYEKICVIANATRTKAEYPLEGEWQNLLSGKPYTGSVSAASCVILKKMI